MKITQVLNNNAVVVIDDEQEKIAIGSGLGYNKGKNDIVNFLNIEKVFVLKENEKLQQLLLSIPEEHFTITEKIIAYAEKRLETKLEDQITLVLADHLSFSINRAEKDIYLKNRLLHEIKVLYKEEFEIGLWAIDYIQKQLKIRMPVDEAGFIALHIHTKKIKGGDLNETVRQTTILKDMVDTIQEVSGITLQRSDISFDRLITHLQFVITRTRRNELHTMDEEMLQMIQDKFSHSYHCAMKTGEAMKQMHGIYLPKEELGYIALHIERLSSQQ